MGGGTKGSAGMAGAVAAASATKPTAPTPEAHTPETSAPEIPNADSYFKTGENTNPGGLHPEAQALMQAERAKFKAQATEDQRMAEAFYTSNSYKYFNEALRRNKPMTMTEKKVLPTLDGMTNSGKLPTNAVLYRGLKLPRNIKIAPGAAIADKAFVSTSFDIGNGAHFARGDALLRIYAPAGTKGHWTNSYESEFTMPRGTTFRIVAVHGPAKIKSHYGQTYPVRRIIDVVPE